MFSSSGPKGVLTKTRILDIATFLWGHFLTRHEHTHTYRLYSNTEHSRLGSLQWHTLSLCSLIQSWGRDGKASGFCERKEVCPGGGCSLEYISISACSFNVTIIAAKRTL